MQDTWHFMGGSRGSTCPGQNGSNNEPSGGSLETHGIMPLEENVTPQKYPRIFIIILLYILGMN